MLKNLFERFRTKPDSVDLPPQPSLALPPQDVGLVVPMIKAADSTPSSASHSEVFLSYDQSPVIQSFAADMVVMYAVDRPNHLEYVTNQVAHASGLNMEQLHARALANLPSRLGNVQLHDCGEGVYGISAGGNFEASLLLLQDLWIQLKDYLPGQPFAAVPSRDLLFVIGSEQPNAVELITSKARLDLREKRYAISQAVLIRRGEQWVAYAN